MLLLFPEVCIRLSHTINESLFSPMKRCYDAMADVRFDIIQRMCDRGSYDRGKTTGPERVCFLVRRHMLLQYKWLRSTQRYCINSIHQQRRSPTYDGDKKLSIKTIWKQDFDSRSKNFRTRCTQNYARDCKEANRKAALARAGVTGRSWTSSTYKESRDVSKRLS